MDMGMDVAWCLTCSTQMTDPRSPYCSEACRLQDTEPSPHSSQPVPLTSPVPRGLMLSPPRPSPASGQHSAFASIPSARRPSINPFTPVDDPSSSSYKTVPRDRRAFSFPATDAVAPTPLSRSGSRRQTATTLQFSRKPNTMALASSSTGVPGTSANATKGFGKLSKTTGANTPIVTDSVFCSTSEGSDCGKGDESLGSPVKSPKALNSLPAFGRSPAIGLRAARPKPLTAVSPNTEGTSSSPLTTRPHLVNRKSPSPVDVAAMIASSASSKSREDIVSWLNEVKRLPAEDGTDDTIRPRGRSRTRREVLADLPSPRHQPLDDHEVDAALSTTPKGRIGSAIAGFSSFGGFNVAPLVKALTGTAVSPPAEAHPSSSQVEGLGLQSVPAPAEVSRVAVTTFPGELDANHMLLMGGATPTLSTVSFSEVIDPLTDGDHLDFYTDDQSNAGSSAFARHMSISSGRAAATLTSAVKAAKDTKAPPASADARTASPLRPIADTASAIWGLSAYLRSFAPFSISSVLAPYSSAPANANVDAGGQTQTTSPAKQPSIRPSPALMPVAAPLPTTRPLHGDDEPESPVQQMVRSLPMNIVLPLGGEDALAERLRQRELQEWLDTPSISPAASRSRSRGRAKIRPLAHSRSASHDRLKEDNAAQKSAHHSHSRHGRKVSYDADASGEDDEVQERRGRSRREKVLKQSSEERRGRGREREREVRA